MIRKNMNNTRHGKLNYHDQMENVQDLQKTPQKKQQKTQNKNLLYSEICRPREPQSKIKRRWKEG